MEAIDVYNYLVAVELSPLEEDTEMDGDLIRREFEEKFKEFEIEDVSIDDVNILIPNTIIISFIDINNNVLDLAFILDEDEGAQVFLINDDIESNSLLDDEDKELLSIDFNSSLPAIKETKSGRYIDLTNLSWLNKSTLLSFFSLGNIEIEAEQEKQKRKVDAFGYTVKMGEAFKLVIRGGKKVKLPLVRSIKKKRLTAAQRAGIRKAARKRKQHMSQTLRKRAKSLNIRRKQHLTNKKLPSSYKIKRS